MPDFAGLSDLGMLQPTQANKSDDINKADMLAQLLENSSALYDELGKARVLDQQYNNMAAQKTPSTLDRLLSPEGIARLLGTAGAAAIGGAPAAAGFGLGSLQSLDAAAEADRAQKRLAMEELNKQRDKVQEQLDKSRNRFTTLLQSQPELFIDPETGKQTVSPKMLGVYATGEPIPLSPTAKRALKAADDQDERRYTLLNERLAVAPDVDSRKAILRGMFQILKSPMDEGMISALASAKPEEANKLTAELIAKYYPSVATDVFIQASELGVPYTDPRVVKLLKGNYKDPDTDTAGKETIPDVAIQAGKRIALWQKDPANAELNRKFKEEAITPTEYSLKLAEEVLGGDRDQFDAYRAAFKLMDPKDLQMTTTAFGDVKEDNATADAYSGYEHLDERMKMTPEEKDRADWDKARERVKASKQAVKDQQAGLDLETATAAVAKLQKSLKMPRAAAQAKTVEIMRDAKNKATRPDGTVDRKRYDQEVTNALEGYIADNTPAE